MLQYVQTINGITYKLAYTTITFQKKCNFAIDNILSIYY